MKYIKKFEKELKKIDFKLLFVFLFISFFVSYIGSTFTVIDSWYYATKPAITPPAFVFPIVWTILFFFMGLAFYFSHRYSKPIYRNKMAFLYGINFMFNILWSFFYFTMHSPLYAFITILLLIASIVSLILVNWERVRIASYMLIPYLIWVCFASILNLLVLLNLK